MDIARKTKEATAIEASISFIGSLSSVVELCRKYKASTARRDSSSLDKYTKLVLLGIVVVIAYGEDGQFVQRSFTNALPHLC